MKKQTQYIIYKVEQDTKDMTNSFDSESLKDIAKWLDIDYSNISKYISKTTEQEKINARLKDNKYFIYKEREIQLCANL